MRQSAHILERCCSLHGRASVIVRELHLYLGLFISPFVLVFAISVFFLVHGWSPPIPSEPLHPRTVSEVQFPGELETLSGRPLIDALRPVLHQLGVQGEVGFVRHKPKEHKFVIPVVVPGRESTVMLDLVKHEASIEQRSTGLADALITLHKAPGPHLASIRMNWFFMRVWRWLADATVYFVLFLSVTGVYLWCVLRAQRILGLSLLAAGAVSFFMLVYALSH